MADYLRERLFKHQFNFSMRAVDQPVHASQPRAASPKLRQCSNDGGEVCGSEETCGRRAELKEKPRENQLPGPAHLRMNSADKAGNPLYGTMTAAARLNALGQLTI
jgi:hypothetical protein